MDLVAGSNVLCIYHIWIDTYTFIAFSVVLLLNMCPNLGGIIVTPSFKAQKCYFMPVFCRLQTESDSKERLQGGL